MDARALFSQGQVAYRRGDYEAAVDLWKRAYAIDARPLLQFNLAQASGRMGKLSEERAALQRFLETATPEETGIEAAASRLTVVERSLARTAISVKLDGLEGARVFVDGEDRGLLPRPDPFRVEPGTHTIEVRLEGYEPFDAHLVVPAGEQVEVRVELAREAGARGVADASPPKKNVTPYVLYGSGGALILTGAILGGLSLSASADAPPAGSADADRSRALAIGADVAIATGAAVAVTGLILHLVGRKSGKERAFVPTVGPGLIGLSASGRF